MSDAAPQQNTDPEDVDRFRRMASEWWDENGKFRPLHRQGPARLTFIRDHAAARFARSAKDARCLAGLGVLDVGCGGGLVAEPLARLGAAVTGIDPGEATIEVARTHARDQGLAIDYRAGVAEQLAAEGLRFDIVLALEVIEHVPDQRALVAVLSELTRPGGLVILSTLNRTLKAFALAIVGAEYVLGWLPRGTHHWDRFVRPGELEGMAVAAGLTPLESRGIVYNPLADHWSLADDTDVNYLLATAKPA